MSSMDTFVVSGERAGLELDEYLCLQYSGLSKGFVRQEPDADAAEALKAQAEAVADAEATL